jgi:hypothetical protein
VPGLIDEIQDESAQNLITEAVTEQAPAENLDRKLRETVLMLRNGYIDRQLAALTMRLREPAITETELIAIERQKTELRQLKQKPLEKTIR